LHHILLRIGDFTLYTYSVLLALAVLAGLSVSVWAGKRASLRPEHVADAVVLALLAGTVGARAEYVLLNSEYFREQPAAVWQVWQGGLAFHGGLGFALLAVLAYAHFRRMPFWTLADALALGMALSVAVGWMACLFGGYAYGQMGTGLLYFNWHDIFGVTANRFAVQPLGAILNLVLFLELLLLALRKPPLPSGVTCIAFLFFSGLVHFGLGFWRGDDTLWFGSWRIDQWLALGQVALAVALAAYRAITLKSRPRAGL